MSVSGTYKGQRFRSLLELAFVRKMERLGYVLGKDLLYETLKVPYVLNGKRHTYVVDFYAPKDKAAFELTWSTHRGRKKKVTKADAAWSELKRLGILYFVEDEKSVGRISLYEAAEIPEVVLDPRSRRRLMRLKKRKRNVPAKRR